MRTPTEKQYARLSVLSIGVAGMSWTRRDTEPLLNHGWVTAELPGTYYQWVRITADGLRALALAVDRYGLPEMRSGVRSVVVCADCDRDWEPACRRCGSRSRRYRTQEHVRTRTET